MVVNHAKRTINLINEVAHFYMSFALNERITHACAYHGCDDLLRRIGISKKFSSTLRKEKNHLFGQNENLNPLQQTEGCI